MLNKKLVQQTIKQAIELVEGIEEPYKSLSFSVILSELLRTPRNLEVCRREITKYKTTKDQSAKDKPSIVLKSEYDWSAQPIINKKPIIQNLLILKIALDEFKIDGLSAKDIQQILFQKYRISKTPNAVSMSLMSAVGKYVDRIQEGKEFLYRITHKGIAYLTDNMKKVDKKQ